MRILFLVKKNEIYSHQWYCKKNCGLFNSTNFTVEGLSSRGIHAKVSVVNDNNDIDREVASYRPHVVIVEALWVVPEKFDVLKRLHPRVKWFIHLHSNIPFLANEGVAIKWLKEYAHRNIGVISNCDKARKALEIVLGENVFYLPNVYNQKMLSPKRKVSGRHMDIGCFGAVRPMKNQLAQAIAALEFAREKNMHLRFHINGYRVEGGEQVIRNLHALFHKNKRAELITHPWYDHSSLVHYLRAQIDIGMQVSLTETFNITSADYVASGLPIVVSHEVPWASSLSQVNPSDTDSIIEGLERAWGWRPLIWWNQKLLKNYSDEALDLWVQWTREIHT